LHIYGTFYSAFAGCIAFILNNLLSAEIIKISGLGLSNSWWQAILVGVFTKAFMKTRLFTVSNGVGDPFPVGIDSIVQIFEPWLLNNIRLDDFNHVRTFIKPHADRLDDLRQVKQCIKRNIPTLPRVEMEAFLVDLDKTRSTTEAMELYLRRFGTTTFLRVFRDIGSFPAQPSR
jgi:hypothetical protein